MIVSSPFILVSLASAWIPPDFGYTNTNSAPNWQNLNPAYNACAIGLIQSPIDLNDTISFAPKNPIPDIPELRNAILENKGVTVEIEYPEGHGYTEYNGTTWVVSNLHFHGPGEHRVFQEFFPVEMHIVSSNIKNTAQKMVMTALFELSLTSNIGFMKIITDSLEHITTPGANYTIPAPINIDPVTDVLSNSATFNYAYVGSLTQPPCTEGVQWVIPNVTFPITVGEFNSLKKVLKFNSRFTQNSLRQGNILEIGCKFFH